ncbi:hypothetical protein YC2023_114536 [Brassica napus]
MGHPRLLTRHVDPIPSDGRCIHFFKARKTCLQTLQSPHDLSLCFDLTHTILRVLFKPQNVVFGLKTLFPRKPTDQSRISSVPRKIS